jgi:hypothetical protein
MLSVTTQPFPLRPHELATRHVMCLAPAKGREFRVSVRPAISTGPPKNRSGGANSFFQVGTLTLAKIPPTQRPQRPRDTAHIDPRSGAGEPLAFPDQFPARTTRFSLPPRELAACHVTCLAETDTIFRRCVCVSRSSVEGFNQLRYLAQVVSLVTAQARMPRDSSVRS